MDNLIHLVRGRKPEDLKALHLARYWCTKLSSWRGRYRRIFCVSFGAVSTQRDDEGLVVTNTYSFIGESDIESIALGKTNDEFIITARADKKVHRKAAIRADSPQKRMDDCLSCRANRSRYVSCAP